MATKTATRKHAAKVNEPIDLPIIPVKSAADANSQAVKVRQEIAEFREFVKSQFDRIEVVLVNFGAGKAGKRTLPERGTPAEVKAAKAAKRAAKGGKVKVARPGLACVVAGCESLTREDGSPKLFRTVGDAQTAGYAWHVAKLHAKPSKADAKAISAATAALAKECAVYAKAVKAAGKAGK